MRFKSGKNRVEMRAGCNRLRKFPTYSAVVSSVQRPPSVFSLRPTRSALCVDIPKLAAVSVAPPPSFAPLPAFDPPSFALLAAFDLPPTFVPLPTIVPSPSFVPPPPPSCAPLLAFHRFILHPPSFHTSSLISSNKVSKDVDHLSIVFMPTTTQVKNVRTASPSATSRSTSYGPLGA